MKNFKRILALILICTAALPLMVSAQASRVYILVVDDFNGNMSDAVEQVLVAPVFDEVLLPLATAADQLGSQIVGQDVITPDIMLEGGIDQMLGGGGITTEGGILGGDSGGLLGGEIGIGSEGGNTGVEGGVNQIVQEPPPILPVYEPLPIQGIDEAIAEAAPQIQNLLESQAVIYGTGEVELDIENCAVNPEGEGAFSSGGAGAFSSGGASVFSSGGASAFSSGGAGAFSSGGAGLADAPHGQRVQGLLQALKDTFAPNADIVIRPVDTEGFTTSILLERIQEEIEAIAAEDMGAPIVINMSFAIVPCTTVGTLAAYDALMSQFDPNIAGDMAALQTFFASLIDSGIYSEPLNGSDTLLGFFGEVCDSNEACQYADSGEIIAVAAAGNEGEPFPYFPAAFEGVVSVSASDDNGAFVPLTGIAPYSNFGGVMMPGIWIHESGIDVGTSFAAPRYSFLMALYLLGENNDFCNTGSIITPKLPNNWGINPPTTPANPNDTIC